MTDQEWTRVVELLTENWSNQLPSDGSLAKMRRDLERFPVEQVLVAIETFYRDGETWPPHGGKVLGRLADLHFDPPPFYEAMRMIRRAAGKSADLIVEDEREEKGWRYLDERMAFLEEKTPLLAGFVRAVGWGHIHIADGGDEARLRGKYEDFVRRARERMVYGGLPAAGLPKLERVVDGEVREIDPAAPPPPRAIPAPGGGVRHIERGQDEPRKMSFGVVANRGSEAA